MPHAVRRPAVAGRFYPAEPAELARHVDELLAGARASEGRPKAVIAPHAGYAYSGPTAACAVASLAADATSIERIVLIGPSHYLVFPGLAVSSASAFETPLGAVAVDAELRHHALTLPQVEINDLAHEREHSLEVLLPFLQRALGGFRLLPLAVGEASPAEVGEALDLLWGDEATRFVVSSDLSHYHDYDTARRLDRASCAVIERLEAGGLDTDDACGARGVNGLLGLAGKRHLRVETLDLRNSGDTAGPRDNVVGYGAWSFVEPRTEPPSSTAGSLGS